MSAKLVHVTSSLMCGGAEKVLYLVIKELQKRSDITQEVLYFHAGPYVAEIERLGIKTQQITGWLFCYDPIFFFRLYKTLWQQKPTLIHSLLWAANVTARVYAWLRRIPIICAYHHNVDTDGIVRLLLDRLTWKCASRVIAVSEQVKSSLKNIGDIESVTVIPNGIDICAFGKYAPVTRELLGIADDTFIIGAVGRLVPIKRFDYLLRVFQLWNNDKKQLIIIGQGSLQQEIQKLIVELNMRDKVLLIADVAMRYYELFDCFVQPSYKEGISLALLEAMSFSKPCIVMGQGGHSVITHEQDGVVIAPDDGCKMLETFEKLYMDKQYGVNLGEYAFKKVEHAFDVATMGERYYQMIKPFINYKNNP